MQIRNKVLKYQAANPSFSRLETVPESIVVIRPRESSVNDQSKWKPDNVTSFTPVKINLSASGSKAASESPKSDTEHFKINDNVELLQVDTDSCQKDRSRSRSRTTTTTTTSSRSSSKASRSRSTSSSTSHGTIKSSSSGTSSTEQIPNLNTTPIDNSDVKALPQVMSQTTQQQQQQSLNHNLTDPMHKNSNQYYNPSNQSMPFNQLMPNHGQQQFGHQFFGQHQQHMGQGYYNQQYDTHYRFILFHEQLQPSLDMPHLFLVGSIS